MAGLLGNTCEGGCDRFAMQLATKRSLPDPDQCYPRLNHTGEGPRQTSAARAAEWSAQELSKRDEGLRHVDEAIHEADIERTKVFPQATEPFDEP